MFDRQLWRYFDWPLFIAMVLLCVVGVGMIYSATFNTEELSDRWIRQSSFLLLGIVIFFAIAALDYRHLEVLAPPSFLIFVVSLVAVDLFGVDSGGAQRWLNIGLTDVQPTEPGKFLLIIFMAWYLSRYRDRMGNIFYLLGALILLLGPLYFVYNQPDLGMTITMAFIGGTLILVNGVRWWQLGVLLLSSLVGLAYVALNSQQILAGYMLERLEVFWNPEANAAASFNIEQALIAVGGGGWFGKGWTLGSQNQLFFLRVRHTDFIFSVIAEELGLIGTTFVLLLLFFVIWRLLRIAMMAQDDFGRLMATGVAAVIFFQVFVNVGMNVNLVPVTGLTLPFISAGGSSLVSMMFAVGLAQSVSMRQRKIEFS